MTVRILDISGDALSQYEGIYKEIPIAFQVRSMFRIELIDGGLGGIALREEKLVTPYVKDYDAVVDDDDEPFFAVAKRNIRDFGIFLALDGDHPVGGATASLNTAGRWMMDWRDDIAILEDIRVHPDFRRYGIGTKLIHQVENWSRNRGCKQLMIETQNINVNACQFYAKQGCKLGGINRYGYGDHPQVGHEVMLIWYLYL